MDLTQKKCLPCETGTPPLGSAEVKKYCAMIPSDWELIDNVKIKKRFVFKDFKKAMRFVNQIADIAEAEGHHPNLFISYNKVTVTLTTHVIKGLSENDFILAAKIEQLTSTR